jgi:hypothetical protein
MEVLENLHANECYQAIRNLCQTADDILFSSTPMDYGEATHFNVQPVEYWADLFAVHGFIRDASFDASFITPWAVRFRKTREPLHTIVRDYERKLWLLSKENQDLRNSVIDSAQQLEKMEEKMEAEVSSLNSRISAVDTERAGLAAELAFIKNSYSWQLTQALQKLYSKAIPSRSRREKILQGIRRASWKSRRNSP